MERLTTHDYVAGVKVGDLKIGIPPEREHTINLLFMKMQRNKGGW